MLDKSFVKVCLNVYYKYNYQQAEIHLNELWHLVDKIAMTSLHFLFLLPGSRPERNIWLAEYLNLGVRQHLDWQPISDCFYLLVFWQIRSEKYLMWKHNWSKDQLLEKMSELGCLSKHSLTVMGKHQLALVLTRSAFSICAVLTHQWPLPLLSPLWHVRPPVFQRKWWVDIRINIMGSPVLQHRGIRYLGKSRSMARGLLNVFFHKTEHSTSCSDWNHPCCQRRLWKAEVKTWAVLSYCILHT